MNASAFFALVRRDLRLFFLDKRAMTMSFAAPILIASFFGYLFGGMSNREPAKIGLAVVDQDGSAISKRAIASLTADKALEVNPKGGEEQTRESVRTGKNAVGVVFPAGFGDAAARAFFRGQQGQMPRFVALASAEAGARNSLLRRWAALPDGSLREEALAVATTENCEHGRPLECATMLARWQRDHPDSPQLAQALRAARGDPGVSPALDANRLAELALLFGDGARLWSSSRPLQRAQNLSRAFVVNYVHAVPFDRRMLAALWRQCTAPACEEARRSAEERFGPL